MIKKVYFSLILVFICFAGFCQNLVNNPGFENVNANCSGLTGAGYVNLIDWDNPDPTDTCSTPDWFATCLMALFPTHAPNTQLGYQVPHGGNAYAGFIAYDQTTANYREYVEGSLSSPMVAGQKYTVSFFISLANNSPISVNHIGIYFSNSWNYFTVSHCVSVNPLTNTPQIDSTFTILDTTNWVQLQWSYTATGGEQYFTLGNFHNNAGTTTSPAPHGPSLTTPFAYYFVDDFSIVADTATQDTTGDTSNPEAVRNAYKNCLALSVYPNPASHTVTVEHTGKQNIDEIEIINSIGEIVYRHNTNAMKETISLDGLPRGIYTIRVQTSGAVLLRRLELMR